MPLVAGVASFEIHPISGIRRIYSNRLHWQLWTQSALLPTLTPGPFWLHAPLFLSPSPWMEAWDTGYPWGATRGSARRKWRRSVMPTLRAAVRPPSGKLIQRTTVLGLEPVLVTQARYATTRDCWRRSRIHAVPFVFTNLGRRGKLREWAPVVRHHDKRKRKRKHVRPFVVTKTNVHHLANLCVWLSAERSRRVRRIRGVQSTGTFASGNLPKLGDKSPCPLPGLG